MREEQNLNCKFKEPESGRRSGEEHPSLSFSRKLTSLPATIIRLCAEKCAQILKHTHLVTVCPYKRQLFIY
jgi:hypothetical protein